MVNFITRFLRGWKEITRVFEETLVDNLSATVPWLAPIIPAYIAFYNMTTVMGFSVLIGWIGAAVIEFLGLATVSTTFWLWDYNDSRRVSDQRAPVQISILTAAFYLTVVIVVNIVLDIGKSPTTHILAKALLSTLSIVAAVTLSIRSQHARRLAEIQKNKDERREERKRKDTEQDRKDSETFAKLSDWRNLPEEDRKIISGMSTTQIRQVYRVSPRTALNWSTKSKQNGRIEDAE
jgi:hypothetical protein